MSLGEGSVAPEYMTNEQLLAQCESLVGGVVCYRAYETRDPNRIWTRYAGKLSREGGVFLVEVGPEYNYIPQVAQQQERRKYPIPAEGFTYTRIVRATVWATEFAQAQADQIAQLQHQLAVANQTAQQNVQDPMRNLLKEIEMGDGNRLGALGGRGMVIETDAYAFNPIGWGHDEHGGMRMMAYLRNKFSAELSHNGQKHYVADALATLQALAMLIPVVPGIQGNEHFVQAAKIQLKRLLIAQMVVRGHNTQYISTFAQAVDTSQMPGWVLQAQSTAATIVKNTQYTMKRQGN